MPGACPVPAVDAPLVRSLLGVTDCHVRALTHAGYASLFPQGGVLAQVFTSLLVIYVALTGYQLMLGRGRLQLGDMTLNAVKLGGVLVFTTQWETYQSLVFNLLFDGPSEIAGAMMQAGGGAGQGDVFDRLQVTFDALSAASAGFAGRSPIQASPFLGGAGFGAFALNAAAGLLLLSSLGVILASKIVLGVLLATGPVFIALLMFDTTRGLFEGWLRTALAFAFAPLAVTFLLAVILSILEPSLAQLAELKAKNSTVLGPVYSVFTLVLVFAGVSAGLVAASAMIFGGFRLPARRGVAAAGPSGAAVQVVETPSPSRAARLAAVVGAQARTESLVLAGAPAPAASIQLRITGAGAAAAASRGAPGALSPPLADRRPSGPKSSPSADGRRSS